MGDHLKKLGLHFSFNKAVVATGETYQAKEVLKKFGFRYDKGSKSWSQKNMNLDFHDLYSQLVKVFPSEPAKQPKPQAGSSGVPTGAEKMAPDTRKSHHDRQWQIKSIEQALKIASLPPSKENDGEMHMVNQEVVYYSIFDATHNDVVWRAVEAAKKMKGGWGVDTILGAAKAREELNKKRAANMKKYGPMEDICDGALKELEEIRSKLEAREGLDETVSGVTGHPINFPFFITLKGRSFQTWFKVIGTLKNGSYKGFQSTQNEGDRKPSKAVQKTVPSGHQAHWKHVPAHEMPDNVMKRFADTSDGDKKIGGDPDAKVTVKTADTKGESTIKKIRDQIASIVGAWQESKKPSDYFDPDGELEVNQSVTWNAGGQTRGGWIKALADKSGYYTVIGNSDGDPYYMPRSKITAFNITRDSKQLKPEKPRPVTQGTFVMHVKNPNAGRPIKKS